MRVHLMLILFAMILSSIEAIAGQEGQYSVGAQGGHVGLMGDAGGRAGNAVGIGALFNYFASDEIALELGLIKSTHTDLGHREFNVGVNYYWGSYDALYPHVALGVAFVNHTIKDATTVNSLDLESSGFGLYGGLGAEVQVGRSFVVGLLGKYNKNFETTLRMSNGTSIKAIEDNVTVMLRVSFVFSGKNAN